MKHEPYHMHDRIRYRCNKFENGSNESGSKEKHSTKTKRNLKRNGELRKHTQEREAICSEKHEHWSTVLDSNNHGTCEKKRSINERQQKYDLEAQKDTTEDSARSEPAKLSPQSSEPKTRPTHARHSERLFISGSLRTPAPAAGLGSHVVGTNVR
jgi:archaellum component FlaD/FlaE